MQFTDTLRLEVALVDGKEMFAWPGAKQFEDKEIRDIVPSGMFGNGNYGIYARMLFGGGGPSFIYRESVPIGGPPALRYAFQVPRAASGFTLRVGTASAVVGFHGSIYLDPATTDLRRLEVFADDIPPGLGIKAAEDRIDYVRSRIGDDEFLLPQSSSLLMASSDNVSRNRVRFSGCRRFSGESSLSFDDEEIVDVAEKAVAEMVLPPRTSLSLQLGEFDLAKSAAGDAVTAVLRAAVRRNRQTLIPKGAVAKGRILRLETWPTAMVLSLQFSDLEWPGGHATLRMELDGLESLALARRVGYTAAGEFQFALPAPANLRGDILRYRTLP